MFLVSEQAGGVNVTNTASVHWVSRFVCASTSFVYVFRKADGRERCLTALYIPGCSLTMNYIHDDTTTLEILPACPRCENDPRNTPQLAELTIGFKDHSEALSWKVWVEAFCQPPMPKSLLKRISSRIRST
jgi:hypothetical protein